MNLTQEQAPKPIDAVTDEGQSEAFIPYPKIGKNLEHVPIHVRPDVFYYQARMGFLPNAIKLYLQTPWIGEHLFRLNNGIMRDERNSLSEHLKCRLALVASKINGCTYAPRTTPAPCSAAGAIRTSSWPRRWTRTALATCSAASASGRAARRSRPS